MNDTSEGRKGCFAMKKFRFWIPLLLCFCLCLPLLAVCALAEPSAPEGSAETSGDGGTPLSPVEQVFQVIALVILFGGLAMLPVYYLLNKRRRRIISSFEQPDAPDEKTEE